MEYMKTFDEVSKNDIKIVGGKGASLGELTKAGLSVPDGFVITTEVFDKLLEDNNLIKKIENELRKVDIAQPQTIEIVSQNIQNLILRVEISKNVVQEIKNQFEKLSSKFVAVRSSATAEDGISNAWAGQLDTFLNTTRDDLLKNVQKCWASLFSPRAIFYRFEKGLSRAKISVAVVVQKMIESEKSGVAFSVHPVMKDKNQIIIEAGFGLGEAVVSGLITPDSYVVGKKPRRIINKNINIQNKKLVRAEDGNKWVDLNKTEGKKQVLTEEQILELSELILKIENHYNSPQDIEWAFADGKFYIVQSRPITTLGSPNERKSEDKVLSFVKNHKFQKQFVYSLIPVICFESYNYCYINNPLREKLGIKFFPIFVVVWNDNYEDWGGGNVQKIRDKKLIEFAIAENRKIIQKHKNKVEELLKADYHEMSNEELIKKLREIDRITIEIYHRYIYLIHDYFETDDDKLIRLLPEVRIEMSEFVDKIYQSCDYVIKALSERFKDVRWETFTYATFGEIISLLKNPETSSEFKKIYKRPLAFVFDGDNLFIIKKQSKVEKIINILKKQEPKIKKGINEFRGNVAFGGRAKGRVVKISEFDYEGIGDSLKNKNDYILVTPMTRPEFVPYLKKCRAIITDEGGITSHAAIVSRELGKPCIIGTKVATQVLKDGDLVEVDADNGVVRILEGGWARRIKN